MCFKRVRIFLKENLERQILLGRSCHENMPKGGGDSTNGKKNLKIKFGYLLGRGGRGGGNHPPPPKNK